MNNLGETSDFWDLGQSQSILVVLWQSKVNTINFLTVWEVSVSVSVYSSVELVDWSGWTLGLSLSGSISGSILVKPEVDTIDLFTVWEVSIAVGVNGTIPLVDRFSWSLWSIVNWDSKLSWGGLS